MPIQFDKYDRQKIDNLKAFIDSEAEKGSPRNYEIFVDGMKAVSKTNDPSQFDNFDNYMTENTNTIRIDLYGVGKSPRNEKYSFALNAKDTKEAIDKGLDGLENKSYTSKEIKELAKQRAKKNDDTAELEALRIKVAEQEGIIAEKNNLISKMQDIIDVACENGNKIGGVHIGKILSVFFEDLLKKNKAKIIQTPGLEGLASFIDDENPSESQQEKDDSEVTFKKKDSSEKLEPELTEQEKDFIKLFHQIVKVFSPQEIGQIIELLERMSRDKTLLKTVLELLQ